MVKLSCLILAILRLYKGRDVRVRFLKQVNDDLPFLDQAF